MFSIRRLGATLSAAALAIALAGCTGGLPTLSGDDSTNGGTVKSVEDDSHSGEPTWKVELRGNSQGKMEIEGEQGHQ